MINIENPVQQEFAKELEEILRSNENLTYLNCLAEKYYGQYGEPIGEGLAQELEATQDMIENQINSLIQKYAKP